MDDEPHYPMLDRRENRRFAEPPKPPSYAGLYALALVMLLTVLFVTDYFQDKKPGDFGLQPIQTVEAEPDDGEVSLDTDSGVRNGETLYAGEGIILNRRPDGHFWIPLAVDGQSIWFLVDTGASDMVLSPRDAETLGYDLMDDDYTLTYSTANGTVKAAPVELQFVAYESLEIWNVYATINQSDMPVSLLGQSFLQRLSGFEVKGDRMILRP